MATRRVPKVGEIWRGRTHHHQKAEIVKVEEDYQRVTWKIPGDEGDYQSTESFPTFWGFFEPELKEIEDAYNQIMEALEFLEAKGEELRNQNIEDGGPHLFGGNNADIYWDHSSEKFYLTMKNTG